MAAIEEEHVYGLQLRESANDGSDFTNPDADYRLVFLGEDGQLHARDSSGTVTDLGGSGNVATDSIWDATGDLVVGTGANTAARLAIGSSGEVLTVSGGTASWEPPTGGSGDDPITDVFGAADDAYEFDSSSLTGWTNLGTATAADADTTVPDHYYVTKAASATTALTGIYRASPSTPFTVICKISDNTYFAADYVRSCGLFVGQATPGITEGIYLVHNTDWNIAHERFTNPTTYNSTIGSNHSLKFATVPLYFGIVVNSTTDFDMWYSFGGRVWRKKTDARDPSITIGSIAIAINPENATHGAASAIDFVRTWDSAKTFPGF